MDEELDKIRERKIREMQEKLNETNRRKGVSIVDETGFSAAIADNPALVIDFWAEWCGPCRMVGPIIEELAEEFAGRIAFAKCNTDENNRLAGRLGISVIPTILCFAHGRPVDRIIGAYPRDALRRRIEKAFGIAAD